MPARKRRRGIVTNISGAVDYIFAWRGTEEEPGQAGR